MNQNVQSIFKIEEKNSKPEGISIEGYGQEAANAVLTAYPKAKVVLLGFKINDEFKPINLSSI